MDSPEAIRIKTFWSIKGSDHEKGEALGEVLTITYMLVGTGVRDVFLSF
jgi:hypothetical protein